MRTGAFSVEQMKNRKPSILLSLPVLSLAGVFCAMLCLTVLTIWYAYNTTTVLSLVALLTALVAYFAQKARLSSCELSKAQKEIEKSAERKMQMEETIRHYASHDLLTGLPNRALFVEHLNLSISRARRDRRMLAVMFMDILRFKNINNTLGHDTGDILLKEVSDRLKACMRESDIIARIGDDEFSMMLHDVNHPEGASKTARKVLSVFQKPYMVGDNELHLSAHVGISLFPDDGENAEALLRDANIALFHAKEQGIDGYQFYNAVMSTRSLERMILENSLRQTLERGELTVFYQPQVHIATRRIVCAEALVRWQHPELGLLNPMRFIPLAEETGLILSIDEWVLRTACTQSKAWQDEGYPPLRIAVNLSAHQFRQPDFVEKVAQILRDTCLNPEFLELEITESAAMWDVGYTIFNLTKLSDMGVKFSIDDFGTGYSSLSYLKRLPIQKLKIDKSFIRGLTLDPDDRAIVGAVIDMAHSLNLDVVAEGVETEGQLAALRASGCNSIQGYLFGGPMTPEDFECLFAEPLKQAPAPVVDSDIDA